MGKSSKLFVGMDVHKDSIDVATGDEGAGEVRHYGAIGGELVAVSRLCRKLKSNGNKALHFVYEAGPCGFGLYRMLRARGHECSGGVPWNDAAQQRRSGEDRSARCAQTRASGAGGGVDADSRTR